MKKIWADVCQKLGILRPFRIFQQPVTCPVTRHASCLCATSSCTTISLTKHFDPWANQLLFLSIFSERETARIVASLIVGSPPRHSSPTRFLSTLHGCEVDLQQFEKFVRQRCNTIQTIRQHEAVLTQYTNIHLISQGIDLWGDQLPC